MLIPDKMLMTPPFGGGGISRFDASVGAFGADFTTLKGALDAGRWSIYVTDNTTETANIPTPIGGFSLFIPDGLSIGMGAYKFTFTSTEYIYIRSNGGGIISYSYGSTAQLFQCEAYPYSTQYIEKVYFDNTSTAAFCYVSRGIQKFRDVIFTLPNINNAGINVVTSGSSFDGIQFYGGGPLCYKAFTSNSGLDFTVSNMKFTGTFKSDINAMVVDCQSLDAVYNNIIFETNDIFVILSGIWSLVNVKSGVIGIIMPTNSKLSHARLGASTIDIGSNYRLTLMDVTTTGLVDMTDSGSYRNKFIGCKFSTALSLSSAYNKFIGCDFYGGVLVNSGGNNNVFQGNRIGADNGSGSLTLTFASGANNNVAIGNQSDVAIVDSGTGNEVAYNAVY